MKNLIAGIAALAAIFGAIQYREHASYTASHAYHKQCPSPFDADIYDCDLWPKKN